MFSIIKRPEYIKDILRVREVVMGYTEYDCSLEQAERLRIAASYKMSAKRLTLPKEDKLVYLLVSEHIIHDADYLEDLVQRGGEDIEDIDEEDEDDMDGMV